MYKILLLPESCYISIKTKNYNANNYLADYLFKDSWMSKMECAVDLFNLHKCFHFFIIETSKYKNQKVSTDYPESAFCIVKVKEDV